MKRKFASGKYARGVCDRCGFAYPYLELREQFSADPQQLSIRATGLRVCSECWDEPTVRRNREADAQSLRDPRPDVEFDS